MTIDEIKALIEAGIDAEHITVKGDNGMFDTIVVAQQFDGLSPVKKQQMVYATVTNEITSGAIHALSIKAYTPKEWTRASKLLIG